jgi:hypothetical protein
MDMKWTVGALTLLVGISGCIPVETTSDPNSQTAWFGSAVQDQSVARAFSPVGAPDETTSSPSQKAPSVGTPPSLPNRTTSVVSASMHPLGSWDEPPPIVHPPVLEESPVPRVRSSCAPTEPADATPVDSALPVPPGTSIALPPPGFETGSAKPLSRPIEPIKVASMNVRVRSTVDVSDSIPGHGKPGSPGVRIVDTAVRVVKSRRISFNFALSDVGPSGVSAVELWYTRDGKEWTMCEAVPKSPPYIVEVDEEGKYGFTLLARSGVGLGKRRPTPGDEPQIWVIVDGTKPDMQLMETTLLQSTRSPGLAIRWNASDKNFGPNPIALSYAGREDGPWQVISNHLPNTGQYVWSLPPNLPGQIYIRVEAVDLAGNVGQAQSTSPIVLDNSTPSVSILTVESGR